MTTQLLNEEQELDCTSCKNPEQCRICVYQTLTDPKVKDFEGSYSDLLKKYFESKVSLEDFYNKMVSFGYTTKTKNEFLKTYCCDLDWAKSEEYCKEKPAETVKEKDKWYPAEQPNIDKFYDRYPCVKEFKKNSAQQMETLDGSIICMNLTLKDGKNVWLYMTDSPSEKLAKYNGLIQSGDFTDSGKFVCKPIDKSKNIQPTQLSPKVMPNPTQINQYPSAQNKG